MTAIIASQPATTTIATREYYFCLIFSTRASLFKERINSISGVSMTAEEANIGAC